MSAIKGNSIGSSAKKAKFSRNNFISKNEILSWINDLLKVNMTLIEQLGSGTMYCQIFDVIYPGSIQLSKVKWSARLEYDFLHNFMILQQGFDKLQVPKAIPVNKLAKTRYQDNLEFAQWMKAYFDFNCKDKGKGYNALKRRGNLTPYFGFCKGGVLPKQTLFFGNAKEKFCFDEMTGSNSNTSFSDNADNTHAEDEPDHAIHSTFQSPPPPVPLPSMLASNLHFNDTLASLPPMMMLQSPPIFATTQSRPIRVGTPSMLGLTSPSLQSSDFNFSQLNQSMYQANSTRTPSKSMVFQQMPSFFSRQQDGTASTAAEKQPDIAQTSSSYASVSKTPNKPQLFSEESGRKYSFFDHHRSDNASAQPHEEQQQQLHVSRLMLSRIQQKKEMMNSAIRTAVTNNNNNNQYQDGNNCISSSGSVKKPIIEEKKQSLTTSNLLSKIQELTNASQILLKRSNDTTSSVGLNPIKPADGYAEKQDVSMSSTAGNRDFNSIFPSSMHPTSVYNFNETMGAPRIGSASVSKQLLAGGGSYFQKYSMQKSSVKRQLFSSQEMDNDEAKFETPLRKQLKLGTEFDQMKQSSQSLFGKQQEQPQSQQQLQLQLQLQPAGVPLSKPQSPHAEGEIVVQSEQPQSQQSSQEQERSNEVAGAAVEELEGASTASSSEANSGNSSDAEESNEIKMKQRTAISKETMSANDMLVSRIQQIMSSSSNSTSDSILAQIKSCLFFAAN